MKVRISLFNCSQRSLETGVMAGTSTAKGAAIAAASEKLLLTIRILQTTLLDAYFIFFKQTSVSIAGTGLDVPVEGFLAKYSAVFNDDLTTALKLLLKSLHSKFGLGDSNAPELSAAFDLTAFLKDEKNRTSASKSQSQSQQSQLRGIFENWLSRIVSTISSRCKTALGGMESAIEVAKLQQRIWQACCTVNAAAEIPIPSNNSAFSAATAAAVMATDSRSRVDFEASADMAIIYSQADWAIACEELLAQKSLGSKHVFRSKENNLPVKVPSKDESSDPSAAAAVFSDNCTYLWSSVFRAPFMVQVERLLQQSCHAVMLKAKQQLIEAFAVEGLTVIQVRLP